MGIEEELVVSCPHGLKAHSVLKHCILELKCHHECQAAEQDTLEFEEYEGEEGHVEEEVSQYLTFIETGHSL